MNSTSVSLLFNTIPKHTDSLAPTCNNFKNCSGRNWALAFATFLEQPFTIPCYCRTGDMQSVALEALINYFEFLGSHRSDSFHCIPACFSNHYRFQVFVLFCFKLLNAAVCKFSRNLGAFSKSFCKFCTQHPHTVSTTIQNLAPLGTRTCALLTEGLKELIFVLFVRYRK